MFNIFRHYYANLLSFFFSDTATTEIYTLSLHDALPISLPDQALGVGCVDGQEGVEEGSGSFVPIRRLVGFKFPVQFPQPRSEEHTSELQSRENLVCRLLLEKKKKKK